MRYHTTGARKILKPFHLLCKSEKNARLRKERLAAEALAGAAHLSGHNPEGSATTRGDGPRNVHPVQNADVREVSLFVQVFHVVESDAFDSGKAIEWLEKEKVYPVVSVQWAEEANASVPPASVAKRVGEPVYVLLDDGGDVGAPLWGLEYPGPEDDTAPQR